MDLLVEKGDSRTYLSRYKVITTSFEESSPSVKRNNTQIQYRNGNVDFGGWHEAKTIDYVGYYRADDIDEEEVLREKIYALLSDPDGYYITQLKNDSDNSYERPGENTGDYFEKQVNRPSHKRFYVYASSLESELVGSYGGHVLYKISATFTTMKLPYGESVPRDLDIKPVSIVTVYGRNLIKMENTTAGYVGYDGTIATADSTKLERVTDFIEIEPNQTYWIQDEVYLLVGQSLWFGVGVYDGNKTFIDRPNIMDSPVTDNGTVFHKLKMVMPNNAKYVRASFRTYGNAKVKLEKGATSTPWSPAPEDPEYNDWYIKIYYNADNLVIPYAGTVTCNQLEQGFIVEFTAKVSGSNLKLSLNGIDFIAPGNVTSGDVFKLSGYEYLRNGISIVKATNKAYFKLLPGVTNKISSSIAGTIRILGYQDLYA